MHRGHGGCSSGRGGARRMCVMEAEGAASTMDMETIAINTEGVHEGCDRPSVRSERSGYARRTRNA